jgi:uncharacterized FlaG/YvyC family protein
MKKLKAFLKKYWHLMLAQTTVDEKVVEAVKETKQRTKRVKKELQDVVEQLDDVVDAAKGKKRRGRKPKK